jgi:hypothetical protein
MNLMCSCKKVAELLLLSQDKPLSFLQQAKLKMHLLRCGNCRNFDDQLHTIRKLVDDTHGFGDSTVPGARQSNE